jgi:hypothetical protein
MKLHSDNPSLGLLWPWFYFLWGVAKLEGGKDE